MDPWSVAAIVGLVFAGQKMNQDQENDPQETRWSKQTAKLSENPRDHYLDAMETANITPDIGRRIGDIRLQPKNEIASLQDVQKKLPFGQPVYNLYNRENISNKMNNVNPGGQWTNVGRGLGVCADVPAAGGFQQFFRVLPNNVNDERLIPLAGNMGGPTNPVVKNGAVNIGDLTHFPERETVYRTGGPSAQGQGGIIRGPEGRPQFNRTERPTIRAETGNQMFGGPAQYNVYQPYVDTGIKSLPHLTGNRSNQDRPGNGQKMNVRADPLSVVGEVTNLRRDLATDHPGIVGPLQGTVQQYLPPEYNDFNEKKSTVNPIMHTLSIGKEVTSKNPYQININ